MTSKPTSVRSPNQSSWMKGLLIAVAAAYLFLILLLPAANVFVQAFIKGMEPFLSNFNDTAFIHAVLLTLFMAGISVPLNTVFGLCAAWVIARHQFRGRALLISILDIPFSVSPVVAGLMIMLLYGRQGWLGPLFAQWDIQIIFSPPSMILATAFVTMPFVAREVIPVLEEVGADQEEAARTLGANDWQVFWRVTLPSIRWGLLYGLILTNARAMGEFGAVSVVSGNIALKTQTLPLYVEDAYKQYNTEASYAAAVVLAALAVITLIAKEVLERKTEIKDLE
ncbi:MAG: sulfate ABC transporter permease subunit CysW [Synechococcales bacterium]|nr:sulfate ABC transporter permease subunit CysW [Cyanobacteria bacterium REEB444]MEB3124845.1 sulfate ABC transporter permease subunit CysW [Synechococcales bacterium]